jgi:hypothetical protein
MTETAAFLADRLSVEGEKTISFFSGLRPEQWQANVYSEGEVWTVRSVLAHYLTAERGFIQIFKQICSGGSGVSDDFDIDRFNSSQQKKTQDLMPGELVEQFKFVRAQMIQLVGALSEEDLARKGRHPFLGDTTLSEMIKMVYRHNQIHHRDIRKLVENAS